MISYLRGKLKFKPTYDDRITLLVNGIGYDMLIPAYVMNRIKANKKDGDELELHVSYNQTERQPKPILVGFESELDKEFFTSFGVISTIETLFWKTDKYMIPKTPPSNILALGYLTKEKTFSIAIRSGFDVRIK